MNKIAFIALVGIFLPTLAGADELVVNLKSGNSLVIQYTGAIQGVTLQGNSDAIVGMNMATKPAEAQVQPAGGQSLPEAQADPGTVGKAPRGSGIQLKWADPKSED